MVGQKIKVASSAGSSSADKKTTSDAKPKTTSSTSQRFTYYTIQSGDNLWDIANKFDVTVSQLKALNKMKNNSRLIPGQKIKIPK
jgi:LysM repeat protein